MKILIVLIGFLIGIYSQTCPPTKTAAMPYAILASGAFTGTSGTQISGGVASGTSITCNSPCTIVGPRSVSNTAYTNARNNVINMLTYLFSLPCTTTISGSQSSLSFGPGVYCATTSISFSGNIILVGNSTDMFVFRTSGTNQISMQNNVIVNASGTVTCGNVHFASNRNTNIGNNNRLFGTFYHQGTANLNCGSNLNLNGNIYAPFSAVSMSTAVITNCTSTSCQNGCCCNSDGTSTQTDVTTCNINSGSFRGVGSTCSTQGCSAAILPTICKYSVGGGTCTYGLSYYSFNSYDVNLTRSFNFFSNPTFNTFLPTTFFRRGNVFISRFNASCSANFNWTISTGLGGNNTASSLTALECQGSCCQRGFCNLAYVYNCTTGLWGGYLSTCNNSLCSNETYISPIYHCTINNLNGTCTAYFGYNNTLNYSLYASRGTEDNIILQGTTWFQNILGPIFNYQINTFLPGYNPFAFFVQFTCGSGPISWTLSDVLTDVHKTVFANNFTTCTGACCQNGSCVQSYDTNCTNNGFKGFFTNCSNYSCLKLPITVSVGCSVCENDTCTVTWNYFNPNNQTVYIGMFSGYNQFIETNDIDNDDADDPRTEFFLPGNNIGFNSTEPWIESPYAWFIAIDGFNSSASSLNYSTCTGYCCNSTYCINTNDSSCSAIRRGFVNWGGYGSSCSGGVANTTSLPFPCPCTSRSNNNGTCGLLNTIQFTYCIDNVGNGTCTAYINTFNNNSETYFFNQNTFSPTLLKGSLLSSIPPGTVTRAENLTWACPNGIGGFTRTITIEQTFAN